ncbi:DUF2849 domain-containing protein [Filomicrobium sp.]|uniref:DUF2849 domain-containing protein n=1 Tax=Filomicrobium sp. TaxID=2024831 RepID=UPI00258FC2CD|nr:DUF2849 domain-containing protein [Filomicrobium sp.]MCV0370527.1 DUF2849 domain-containing protein [Filomicrobium sp.]
MPNIITANLLRTGDVVYFAGLNNWVREIGDATVAKDKDELSELEKTAQRDVESQRVISVYAMDVELVNGRPEPRSVRERIRAALGPSV